MALLGPQEKAELGEMILARLDAHFTEHGPAALLQPGVFVVVSSRGVEVTTGAIDPRNLACVEVRTLFTALCYITDDGGLPPEGLEPLANEATTAAAAQINRIGAGRSA
ncbi:hypothetical protein BWI17_06725 [Betaproteobacteria bacterium GR16-43]|nr:hypothetical protein BWI17_06725 [Betaproteobacteria bacterium GR16-43]